MGRRAVQVVASSCCSARMDAAAELARDLVHNVGRFDDVIMIGLRAWRSNMDTWSGCKE